VVELPRNDGDAEPLMGGFGEAAVDVDHRLSFRVLAAPTNATTADGHTASGPVTVAVAAGETPVTLRYQFRVDDRSTERTAVVPAGEARTITRELSIRATANAHANTSTATLRVTAETPGSQYVVHEGDLEVRAGE